MHGFAISGPLPQRRERTVCSPFRSSPIDRSPVSPCLVYDLAMSNRECIYIAARAIEAKHVKHVLRQAHIDYAVESSSTRTGWHARFPRYSGMQFYVDPQHSRDGRQALHRAGLVKGNVGEA